MPTATITLTVNDNTTPSCLKIAQPSIDPGGGGNRVRLRNSTPSDTTIIVQGKGSSSLDLVFKVTNYTFVGSAPMTISGSNASANFQNQTVSSDGTTVTITDVFANTGPKGGTLPSWSYALAVKDASNNAGTIDPGIENEAQ